MAAGPDLRSYRSHFLDQCATTREAIALLQRLPHGLSYNYSLIDAGGDAAVVEASPTAIVVRRGDALACTNHFQSPELETYNRRNPGSRRRLQPLEDWARARPAADELFSLLNSSRSPVFDHGYAKGGGTLHTLVCLPTAKEMLVGIGGDASPVRINVADWSKGEPLSESRPEGQLGGTLKPFDPKRRVREANAGASAGSEKLFVGTDLANAVFRDLTLKNASFNNIYFAGASFDDVNLADAVITDNCNFKGMRIAGVSVADLFAAYNRARSGSDA